jgi:hypothetical protein
MTSYNKEIQINRGENPKRHEVLDLLVNSVFYADGAPWQPTPDQVAGLAEIFGIDELAELRSGKAVSTGWNG